MGKERLTEWVKREIFESLKDDLRNDKGFEVDVDGEEIWWWLSDSGKLWWDVEKKRGFISPL